MNRTSTLPLATLLAGLSLAAPALADYGNDFSAKTDADFTRYSPLAAFGAPGTFTFPSSGGYSLAAAASPAPGQLGPARAGSFLTGQTYSDFTVSYEIQGYSTANSQFMGVFGRVSTPGLGTLNAYAMGIDTVNGGIFISRVKNEASLGPIGPNAFAPVSGLDPSSTYLLSFSATGSEFTGSIRDKSGTLLASVSGSDSTLASGQIGFGVAAQTVAAGAVAQATFGNFQVSTVPEPSTWALLAVGTLVLGYTARRRA
jgi:hypothetical protein